MPNVTQVEFLNSMIAKDGDYFETIRENATFNLGTKVLYLERAISQNCHDFLQSLDKLYNPDLNEAARNANIEFIRALKLINDLCFNNEVKYDPYGTREALTHYFGHLGVIEHTEFQTLVQTIINQHIATLQENHAAEATAQKTARENAETDIARRTEWRVELDLPMAQRDQVILQHGAQGFFQPQQNAPAVHPVVNFDQIQLYIHTIIPEASRAELLQVCRQEMGRRVWPYISVHDMPVRLNQFAQIIPNNCQIIQRAAQNCVARAIAFQGTTQCFFMNDNLAKEVLVSTLLLGQYQHNDDLKNLALDLIANMHLKNYVEENLQHLLGRQLPGHAM